MQNLGLPAPFGPFLYLRCRLVVRYNPAALHSTGYSIHLWWRQSAPNSHRPTRRDSASRKAEGGLRLFPLTRSSRQTAASSQLERLSKASYLALTSLIGVPLSLAPQTAEKSSCGKGPPMYARSPHAECRANRNPTISMLSRTLII